MLATFTEFRDLENLASKSEDKFLNKLDEHLKVFGLKSAILALKGSGICVDLYGTGKYKDLFEKSLKLLSENSDDPDKEIAKLTNQVNLFNRLFEDFKHLRRATGVEQINISDEIPAFLLCLEILISSAWDNENGMKVEDLNNKYPFFAVMPNGQNVPSATNSSSSQLLQILDNIMENAGLVIKYLMYTGANFNGLSREINLEDIKTSRAHISLIDKYDRLYSTHDYWRFFDSRLVSQTSNEVYFEPINSDTYLSHEISNARYRLQKTKWMLEFSYRAKNIVTNPNTNILAPAQVRTPMEVLAEIFCNEFFGSNDLSERLLDVNLSEWIRAYVVINQIASNFYKTRNPSFLSLSEWCIVKSREEWVQELCNGGIDPTKAETILNRLTFNSKSKDLLDCPLLPFEDKLLSIPSISAHIEPASALLSNFINNNLDVSFKGKGLEERVRKKISSLGFPCSDIYDNFNGDEYECDAVFVINNDLFFIECKSFMQPHAPREHYELIDKISSAANQLNRIADHFSTQIEKLKEKLELNAKWAPKNIYKIVLCSAMLGEPTFINDCYVIDESIFRKFFDREPPAFAIGNLRLALGDANFEGNITSDKLLDIINNPPQIKLMKEQFSRNENSMQLYHSTLKFFHYIKNTGDFYKLDKAQINQLAKIFKIPKDLLKKELGVPKKQPKRATKRSKRRRKK